MASTEPIEIEKEVLSKSVSDTHSDTQRSAEFDLETDAKRDKVPLPTRDDSLPDPRFNPSTPSSFKRAALILFAIILFWIAFNLRSEFSKNNREANVVYASRYSKEHKFRPAASPVVTETLKDGRVRIRGAAPTATPAQTPTPIPKKVSSKKTRKGKVMRKKDERFKARK
ncbi:hypothetical protein E4T56_gene7917 [Termitomyces sp. T112]|nr:hypothetical protein C0989_005486 [Termitomyces sp. Mn162]KAG5716789.1 hypothetical protein E4T56_gene7917 [Termitomyces sp. T112]